MPRRSTPRDAPGGPFADCLIVNIFGNHIKTNNSIYDPTAWANASLDGGVVTQRENKNGGSNNGGGIAIVSGTKATAGAISATTGLLTTAAFQTAITMAIQGAGGAPTLLASDFCCGGECDAPIGQQQTGARRHWDTVLGTPPVSQTLFAPRSGGRAWRFSPINDVSALARNVSDTKRHMRGYLYFPSIPNGDCELIRNLTASGAFAPELRFRFGTQDIVAECGSNIGTPQGVVANKLYLVAAAADVSGASRTMKLTVDGVDRGTATKAAAADVITQFQIGASCGTPVTADVVWGAIITGQDVTAYPYAAGQSVLVQFTADGVHVYNAGTDFKKDGTIDVGLSATNLYTYLVGLLSNALATYIGRGTASVTEYIEELMGGMPTVTSISAVEVISVHKGNSVASPATTRIVDGVVVQDLLTNVDFQGAGPFVHSKHYRLAPSGVSWTQALINALKIRFGFSATGTPGLGGVALEVDCVLPGAGPLPSHKQKNPSHVYAGPGTYSVTETVRDKDGLVGVKTRSVTVA